MSTDPSVLNMDIPTELFGRFTVGPKIAERPGCIVCRGTDRELGDRAVVIKLFLDKPNDKQEWISAFEREVAMLRSASHPALIPIIAGGCDRGWFFIAMEFVDGMTLRDFLKSRSSPVETERAVDIITQLCGGVKEIHEKNGFHGHIDSRGIFFKGEDVRLAGYVPHVLGEIQKLNTSAGAFVFDPAYVSPDQMGGADGPIDGRADIYSLAVILYEMITGKKPFSGDNPMQTALMRLTKDPEPPRKHNSSIPAILDAAIMKGLSRDRNQRFSTIADFLDALTGGKKPIKNPLLAATGANEGERLTGTETIAVSMSTDSIKHLLQNHETKRQAEQPKAPVQDPSVVGTMTGMKVTGDTSQLSGVATALGLKVEESLKGSFIIVAGENRGKKFFIDKPQVMIGSDAGCEVSIPDKKLPPRYAIVVNRNGEFYVGALSGNPVKVNSREIEGTQEAKLNRGDVIEAAGVHLRFVAPGEVFTLKDEVADRVIDRPPSKMPKVIATLALAGVVLCGGLIWVYRDNVAAKERQVKAQAEKRKKQQKEVIEQLRLQGDEFFRTGALIEPVDLNARKRFEQILEIDPEDTYAKRRLSEIDERVRTLTEQDQRRKQFADRIAKLITDGDAYFKKGNYISPPGSNARETYQEILRLDPQNVEAQKQLAEINRILSDLVGQISGLLAKAREYVDKGQYVYPPGENAKEMIDRVFSVDPSNAEAKAFLIDMAARAIMDGDAARGALDPDTMRTAFLTAQALGVDPDFVNQKLQGIDTIKRSKGSVVIIDTSKGDSAQKTDGKFLDMNAIEQRINILRLQGYGQSVGEKQLYEINKGKIK